MIKKRPFFWGILHKNFSNGHSQKAKKLKKVSSYRTQNNGLSHPGKKRKTSKEESVFLEKGDEEVETETDTDFLDVPKGSLLPGRDLESKNVEEIEDMNVKSVSGQNYSTDKEINRFTRIW